MNFYIFNPVKHICLIFTDIHIKQARTLFGPIIENYLVTRKLAGTPIQIIIFTAILHNHNLLRGGQPAACPICQAMGFIYLDYYSIVMVSTEDLKEQ